MNKSTTFPLTLLLGKLGLMLGRVKLLVISLILFGLSLYAAQVFAQTQMKQATGGTGKYRNSIYWFDFTGLNMNAGETRTYQFTANGVDITVVIDQLTNPIRGYRPGSFTLDRMDDMYNIGGLQGSNTLTNAISAVGVQSNFRLRAYATFNGQPANIGLVFGNGETDLIEPNNEFSQATTNGEAWRLLEAGAFSPQTERQITFSNNNQTARISCYDNVAILYTQKSATSDTAPLTINAAVKGGGQTAMALGVMTYAERGDAPTSYGIASHNITPSITGGSNPGPAAGSTVYIVNPPTGGRLISPGTVAPASTPKLGALSGDFDPSSFTSLGTNADADDLDGQDDEDGIVFEPLPTNATSYSTDAIVENSSGSTAYLVGWVDFNKNGTFEETEGAAATVANGATTATLNWTGLSGLTAGPTYARFRISTSPNLTVANPNGSVDNGETEDYLLTIVEPVEICGNGIDDDGNGLADCDDPACNPYVNYFANGSLENYTQCPNLSAAGTLAYAVSWKTSLPAPNQTGGQLLVNDPAKGCVSPRPATSWLASTNLPAGSDGLAWGGMHGGAPNLGFEDFQNTLIAPLPAGTYTFTFSAGYLVNNPYTAPGYFKFYGVKPGEADFTTAHPLGDSPMINNAISSTNPTWKEYSFSFTSTEVYDRIYMVAYSGPTGQSYLVFDGFKMVYNPPTIGFQNPLATCLPDAVIEVKNPDPAWVSYQWYMDGELLAGATGVSYQPTTGQLGVFTVSGVLASGCMSAPSAGITLGSNCPIPFECNGSAYLVSTTGGTVPSILSIVDAGNPNTVHATITPSIADQYNGIGFNFEDNLIYGYAVGTVPSLTAGDIVQFDAKGTVRRLGAPTPVPGQAPGLPRWTTNAAVNANGGIVNLAPGVVGLNNKFYGMVTTNVATNRYLVTVDLTTMTYTTVKLSGNYVPADLAFSPYDGMLYGLAGNVLIRTNPNNGNQQAVTPTSGTLPANVGAGGAWNDVLGRVYFFTNSGSPANGAERLYRYNPANGAFVNVVAVTPYPGFDATACFPTRLEKKILMPTEGLKPGDVVEFEFSIYNSQMLPMTYEFEDILTSTDLSWVPNTVNPATPGGGTVSINGNTLRISGITVPPAPASGGEPLRFRVSLKVADNAAYGTCYTNQATIKVGGITVLSDNPETSENNDPTAFCLNPCALPAPISGGNLQACLADLNGGKLTASATVPADIQLIWYDAPTGGNVVADPSLSTVGTVTFYAAADDGSCVSSRTPVTLNITATPILEEVQDIVSCGPFELPTIVGEHLSGNEAYYTAPNGGGTKYLAGDLISTPGTSSIYIFDQSEALANCQGSLAVATNTDYVIDNLFDDNTHFQYTGAVNPAFFQGTASQQIRYDNPGTPVGSGPQTYLGVVGDVSVGNTADCFGTEVNIQAQVTITNQGPGNGAGYSGRLAIFNKATNQVLYQVGLRANFPVNATMTPTVSGVVPVADVLAGNIAVLIAVETFQTSSKNWLLSNFRASYQFLPESTQACAAERSFELTINEAPAAPTSGGNQQACISDITDKLTATATAPDGTQLIWYDAPVGGNVVTDPSLDTVGTITYFAAADNGTCTSTTRTPVTLSITASPVLDEIEDVAVCEVFTLPEIIGTGLSRNQAYYTEPNAGGTKYLPGDQLATVGTTTLYVYDESGRVENCAGSLSVVANTGYPKVDFDQMVNQNTVMQYPRAINPAFWSGTATQTINYSAADPIVDGQTYPAIIGKVNIADTDNCFGTDVLISADVTVTNNGPTNGFGGIGYFSIINTATNTRLFNGGMPMSPAAGTTFQAHVEGVVPVADVLAGNISIMIVVETYHVGIKNWTLSNFKSGYKFLPEVAQNCFDEKSFKVTINEPPVLVITDPAAVCLPGTVDITANAVTQGSTAGLTYTYFTDSLATSPLASPEAIAVSGTYYIMGTNPATGCSSIAPVEVTLIGQPELRVGQPTCLSGVGSIEVLSPLGADFEYSIDGSTYQTDPLFVNVNPGTYQVTARNIITNCVSQATEVTIDALPQAPAVTITQPSCDELTGTIEMPKYPGAEYSITNGLWSTSNVFIGLAPGDYQVWIRDANGCVSEPTAFTINEAPQIPNAPTSGGSQVVCEADLSEPLRATATTSDGSSVVWYDAPTGGNVVGDPILDKVGTIIYYAEAFNGTCNSFTRTPVILTVVASPVITPQDNLANCGPIILPEIEGTNLTGNEAYYTEVNGGGTKYLPGDEYTEVGTRTLYIYDRMEEMANCAGEVSVSTSAKMNQAKLTQLMGRSQFIYPRAYNNGFWNGTDVANVTYNATDPIEDQQTYMSIIGDVALNATGECFGTEVMLDFGVRLANQGPHAGIANTGRIMIINNRTLKVLYVSSFLGNGDPAQTVNLRVAGAVPLADAVAGDVSVVVLTETYQVSSNGTPTNKSWIASNFTGNFSYLPEVTASCASEQSFTITVDEMPTAFAGDDQVQYNSGAFTLNATAPTLGTGEWTVVSGTPSVAISDSTNPNATISLDANTSVTLRWTVTNGTCVAFDDVVLNYVSQADIVTVKQTSEAG
ncbi:CshA/CshB family fibrillar adhesin-related protein, partial [Olivibacter sp. 47]|uniref:CshA/CshB family fibrillar adhesin-related protein n=1 Tax=Olivibacter sp. 47 TaxID=3056486 RepID=UPI0025A3F572